MCVIEAILTPELARPPPRSCLDDTPAASTYTVGFLPGERLSAYEQCLQLDDTFTGVCVAPAQSQCVCTSRHAVEQPHVAAAMPWSNRT